MVFPQYIKKGDTIAAAATSGGVTDEIKQRRVANATKKLGERGYNTFVADNAYISDNRGCAGSGMLRAHEFNRFLKNPNVSAIISLSGGDYLMEMLEGVDFERLKAEPKWFQGYSDNTALIYPIVTMCDVAAVYGCHFGDFGMDPWQRPTENAIGVLEGKVKRQDSFEYYEDNWHDYVTGFEGYEKDKPVYWKNALGEEKIKIRGRLLGGCLDVLSFLVGTRYDCTLDFVNRYGDDGILWALESFAMDDTTIVPHLWQMKERGYFKNAAGFVFGRPMMYNAQTNQSYMEAVMSVLGSLGVPVVFEADLGHKGPQFSFILGAVAEITSAHGKGCMIYT